MKVKILGSGCAKCEKTAQIVSEAIAETGADATIEKVTDWALIAAYGVMTTPAVLIGGDVKCSGRIPSKQEVAAWLGAK